MSGLQFTDATATSERPEDETQVVPGETWLRGPDDPIRSKVTHTFFNRLKANFNKLIVHYGSTDDGDDMLLNAVRNAAEPYSYVSTIGPPTTSDNAQNTSGRGAFALGSKWYDKNNTEVYRCLDPINGSWVKTSLTIDELGSAAVLDVGTGANRLVQLDADGKLPAVDGSQLTNIGGVTQGELGTFVALKDRQPIIFKASGVSTTDYSRSWIEGAADIANIGQVITATPSADAEKLLCFIQINWSIEQTGIDDDARGALSVRFENSSGSYEDVVGPYALLGYTDLVSGGRPYNSCTFIAEVNASDVNASGDWNISLAFDPSDDSTSGYDATFTIHYTHYILQEVLND